MELDVRWSHDFLLSRKGEKGPLLTFAADAFNAVRAYRIEEPDALRWATAAFR